MPLSTPMTTKVHFLLWAPPNFTAVIPETQLFQLLVKCSHRFKIWDMRTTRFHSTEKFCNWKQILLYELMVAAHKYSNRWNNKFTNKSAGISFCLLFTNTKTNAATNLTWWNNGCCTRLGLVADTIAGEALEHPVVPCTPDRWHYFFSNIQCISVFIFSTFSKALEHTLILCTSSWNTFFSCPFREHLLSIFFKPMKHLFYIQFVAVELDTAYLYSVTFVKKTRSPQRFDAGSSWWKDQLNVLQSMKEALLKCTVLCHGPSLSNIL